MKTKIVLLSLLFGTFVEQAPAYVITADPSAFAAGTDVTHAYEGMTLNYAAMVSLIPSSYEVGYLKLGPIYTLECIDCKPQVEGTAIFSPYPVGSKGTFTDEITFASGFKRGGGTPYGDVLMAIFDKPTNYVEILGSGDALNTAFRIDYWDKFGHQLGYCFNGSSGGDSNTPCTGTRLVTDDTDPRNFYNDQWIMDLRMESPDIAFVTMGGAAGPVFVSQISYSVPEPSPAALIFGVMSFIGLRRLQSMRR